MVADYHLTPIPWNNFPQECLWYFVPMSVLHVVAFVFGCIVLVLFPHKQPGTLKRRIGRLGLFLVLFLIVSSLLNGVWSCLIWNHLYHSSDYIFDFTPVWPITWGMITRPFGNEQGQLLGVSLFQLQMIWFLFAASSWGITILLYRWIRGYFPSNSSVKPELSVA